MATYALRRIIQAIPILFGISILIFLIVQLAPGSPIDRFRNPRVSPEQLAAINRLYGLDRPLFEQYIHWITAYVQIWRVDAWGYSFIDGQPVLTKVGNRLPSRKFWTRLLHFAGAALYANRQNICRHYHDWVDRLGNRSAFPLDASQKLSLATRKINKYIRQK